jgi:dTDP-4-amino-4,6-dideoxygalactose transaminase
LEPKPTPKLLVSSAIIGEAEKQALSAVIDSGWLTMGERVQSFETAFAAAQGAEDCVAVSSCTAALHLILYGLGVGTGDEVLVPSLTFVATANAVLYVGAKPVFVDIESPSVPHMSLADAESRITPRTKAIILVHFAGYLANLPAWRDLADKHGLYLVEDAAHAPGLTEVGAISDGAAFSFYGNKNMTTGEGGAVIARDNELLQCIRQARGHGMTSGTRQRLNSRTPTYDVTMLGFNYRLDELRAAIGLIQLEKLPQWNRTRAYLSIVYRKMFEKRVPEIGVPFTMDMLSAHHIMPVLLPPEVNRQGVVESLAAKGIQTTIHYTPIHRMTFYRQKLPEVSLPHTEDFASRELTLPLHPLMTENVVEEVVAALDVAIQAESEMERAA